jgi:hypothetical protein
MILERGRGIDELEGRARDDEATFARLVALATPILDASFVRLKIAR